MWSKTVLRPLILTLLLLAAVQTGLAADSDLSIYYTASLNGNLIGCECKGVPKAGLSTTAAYLRTLEAANSVIIDLGDFSDARTDELLSEKLVGLYSNLGYEFAAVGDQEFGNGADFFLSMSENFNFLCNNMRVDGEPLGDGPVVIEKNRIKLGFAAVIEPSVFFFYPDDLKRRLEITDPAAAASESLARLQRLGCDYNVLLFHGHSAAAREIFDGQPGWDAVLFAHDQALVDESPDGRIFASPGEEGNRIGRIALDFRFGRLVSAENSLRYFKYEKDPEDPAVLGVFEDYKKELIANLKNGGN